MTPSPVHANGLPAILKHTKIILNSTFTTAPVMPSLNQNLLQRDVFDYDFNRERIFLEIAEAEIAAMRKAENEEKVAAASEQDDSDDELARQSAKLPLSSSLSSARHTGHQDSTSSKPRSTRHTGHQDSTSSKPRSTSEEDIAAAISASLREY